MEHITVTEIKKGLFELIPDEGYVLTDKWGMATYSNAVTDKPEFFRAVTIDGDNEE